MKLAVDPAPALKLPVYDFTKRVEIAHTFTFRRGSLGEAAISAQGNTIVCTVDSDILCIDPMTRKTMSTIPTDKGARPVPTPDSSKVAIVCPTKKYVALHATATGKKLSSFEFFCPSSTQYAFSPGGRYLLALESLRGMSVWDVVEGKQVGKANVSGIQSMQISPDGRYLLFCDNKTLYLHDFATLKQIRTYAAPFAGFESGGFSPDSKLVYATWSGRVGSFDRVTGNKVMEYKPKGRTDRGGIWVSPDNQFLVVNGTYGNGYLHCDTFRVGQPAPITSSVGRRR